MTQQAMAQAEDYESRPVFISQDDTLRLLPGMTKARLAQLRFRGDGPPFYKPTPKTVLYKEHEVLAWASSTRQTMSGAGRP